jgi:hypothetical protein
MNMLVGNICGKFDFFIRTSHECVPLGARNRQCYESVSGKIRKLLSWSDPEWSWRILPFIFKPYWFRRFYA